MATQLTWRAHLGAQVVNTSEKIEQGFIRTGVCLDERLLRLLTGYKTLRIKVGGIIENGACADMHGL
jgi:carbamoylphosphate synthase small subunit